MPDESGRTEADLAVVLLQAPAYVHVVTRLAENGIEPADRLEGPFVKGHVAAGNVLGFPVCQHHVSRSARGDCHGCRKPRIFRRQKVVPSHANEIAPQQIIYQIIEPVLVRSAVVVGEGNDLALRGSDARVPGSGQPRLVLAEVANARESPGDLRRGVAGAVVHEEHLVVRVVQTGLAIGDTFPGSGRRCRLPPLRTLLGFAGGGNTVPTGTGVCTA